MQSFGREIAKKKRLHFSVVEMSGMPLISTTVFCSSTFLHLRIMPL